MQAARIRAEEASRPNCYMHDRPNGDPCGTVLDQVKYGTPYEDIYIINGQQVTQTLYELNIPITDIKDIPLKQNSNTLQDILFPFSVLEEEDTFDDLIDIYQNIDLDPAIEIADKLTNGEFSSFLSDGDYVS